MAIVAVVLVGGYFLFRSSYQSAPSVPQTSNQQPAAQPPAGQTPSTDSTSPQQAAARLEDSAPREEKTITYTDSGYSPSNLSVKKGETVTFKNQSSQSMWTAAAVHPSHRAYPTTGGCLGSTFDACTGIRPDDSWSFKFDISGSWKYHNHLNPGDTGTIVVE